MGLGREAKAVKPSSTFWDSYYMLNERKYYISMTGDKFRVHARLGTCITHAPLQVFGDMLSRRTKNRIQSWEDKMKLLNVGAFIVLVCVSMFYGIFIQVSACVCVGAY